MVEVRYTCPFCGSQVTEPGWFYRAFCTNCEDYVVAVQHIINYDPTSLPEHLRY